MLPTASAFPTLPAPPRIDGFAALELLPSPAAVFDPERRVRVWNRAAEACFGWAAEEVLGGEIPCLPPDRRDEYEAISARVRAGETIRDFDTVQLRRDGTAISVSLSLRAVTDFAGGTWVIVTMMDISGRRKLQSRLSDSLRRHREAMDALRVAQVRTEELTGMVVHDFKTPIAAAMASLEFVFKAAALEPEAREAVEDALRCTETLHEMTLDLLDTSRAGNGALAARRVLTDVPSILRQAIFAGAWGGAPAIDFRWSGTEQATVDPDLLRRVVQNLLDNARKYGGRAPILLSAMNDGERLVVSVADSGPGIPVELRERVFEKYFRVESPEAALHARTSRGLGLAFCKLAAEAHGGSIRVESGSSGGSCFIVDLPSAAPPSREV